MPAVFTVDPLTAPAATGRDDDQVTEAVRFCVVRLLKVPMAVNCLIVFTWAAGFDRRHRHRDHDETGSSHYGAPAGVAFVAFR